MQAAVHGSFPPRVQSQGSERGGRRGAGRGGPPRPAPRGRRAGGRDRACPTSAARSAAKASETPPGPAATWSSASSTSAVGASSTIRCRRIQVAPGSRRRSASRHAREVEHDHLEQAGAGERPHRGDGLGQRVRPAAIARAARAGARGRRRPRRPRRDRAGRRDRRRRRGRPRASSGRGVPARGRCAPTKRGRRPRRAGRAGSRRRGSASIGAMPVGSGRSRRSSPRSGGASAARRRARSRSSRADFVAEPISLFLRHDGLGRGDRQAGQEQLQRQPARVSHP